MSVCCTVLDGTCESVVLGPCPSAPDTRVTDAGLLEVCFVVSRACCKVCDETSEAAFEGDALVSGCAVESIWEDVTPFPACSTVDERVACGALPSPLT